MRLFLSTLALYVLVSLQGYSAQTVLITAFEPFENREINNSTLVALEIERLINNHHELKDQINVEVLILPVEFDKAAEIAKNYINEMPKVPDFVVSFGESKGLSDDFKPIRLERSANNKRSLKHENSEYKIRELLGDSLNFNYPLKEMYCGLNKEDKKLVAISQNISTYVCNNTAFHLGEFLKSKSSKEQFLNQELRKLARKFEQEKWAMSLRHKNALENFNRNITYKWNKRQSINDKLPEKITKVTQIDQDIRSILDNTLSFRQTLVKENGMPRRPNWDERKVMNQYEEDVKLLRENKRLLQEDIRTDRYQVRQYSIFLNNIDKNRENLKLSQEYAVSDLSRKYYEKVNHLKDTYPIGYFEDDIPYGFIHFSTVTTKDKAHFTRLARSIAMMIKNALRTINDEVNFPYASYNENKGIYECGENVSYTQSSEYKALLTEKNQYRSKLKRLENQIYAHNEFPAGKPINNRWLNKLKRKEDVDLELLARMNEYLELEDNANNFYNDIDKSLSRLEKEHISDDSLTYFDDILLYEEVTATNEDGPFELIPFLNARNQNGQKLHLRPLNLDMNNNITGFYTDNGLYKTGAASLFKKEVNLFAGTDSYINLSFDEEKELPLIFYEAAKRKELNIVVEYPVKIIAQVNDTFYNKVPKRTKIIDKDGNKVDHFTYEHVVRHRPRKKIINNLYLRFNGDSWALYDGNMELRGINLIYVNEGPMDKLSSVELIY